MGLAIKITFVGILRMWEVGHVAWQVGESLISNVRKISEHEINKTWTRRIGRLLVKETFDVLQQKSSVEGHGGAPLLGVTGTCIITNPQSSSMGVHRAIEIARKCYRQKINLEIANQFNPQNSDPSVEIQEKLTH